MDTLETVCCDIGRAAADATEGDMGGAVGSRALGAGFSSEAAFGENTALEPGPPGPLGTPSPTPWCSLFSELVKHQPPQSHP